MQQLTSDTPSTNVNRVNIKTIYIYIYIYIYTHKACLHANSSGIRSIYDLEIGADLA